MRDYYRAIAGQDGEAACAQLTADLRADVEKAPAARAGGRTCADVMRLAAGLNPSLEPAEIDDLDVEVDESGDRAVASLESPLVESAEKLDLRKEDGEWRIATLETRPRP